VQLPPFLHGEEAQVFKSLVQFVPLKCGRQEQTYDNPNKTRKLKKNKNQRCKKRTNICHQMKPDTVQLPPFWQGVLRHGLR